MRAWRHSSTPWCTSIGRARWSPSNAHSCGQRSRRRRTPPRCRSLDSWPVYDVVVVGKANVDYLVRGPRLPKPGHSVNGDYFQEAPGGKGANQATGAARLGARVAFVGRVGADARGDSVLAALAREGVDVRHVTRDPVEHTGVAICQVGPSGEKQILSAPGANARLTAACVREAADALGSTRVVLCQLGVPREAV